MRTTTIAITIITAATAPNDQEYEEKKVYLYNKKSDSGTYLSQCSHIHVLIIIFIPFIFMLLNTRERNKQREWNTTTFLGAAAEMRENENENRYKYFSLIAFQKSIQECQNLLKYIQCNNDFGREK